MVCQSFQVLAFHRLPSTLAEHGTICAPTSSVCDVVLHRGSLSDTAAGLPKSGGFNSAPSHYWPIRSSARLSPQGDTDPTYPPHRGHSLKMCRVVRTRKCSPCDAQHFVGNERRHMGGSNLMVSSAIPLISINSASITSGSRIAIPACHVDIRKAVRRANQSSNIAYSSRSHR
jgi:hypothetical protein